MHHTLIDGIDERRNDVVNSQRLECKTEDAISSVLREVGRNLGGHSEGSCWNHELITAGGTELNKWLLQ